MGSDMAPLIVAKPDLVSVTDVKFTWNHVQTFATDDNS